MTAPGSAGVSLALLAFQASHMTKWVKVSSLGAVLVAFVEKRIHCIACK